MPPTLVFCATVPAPRLTSCFRTQAGLVVDLRLGGDVEQVDLGVALDVCADIDFVGHLCGAQLAKYDWRARWPLARRNTHAPSWLQKIPRAAEVHSIPHLQRHHSPGQCVRPLVACCPSLSAARPCLGRMHGDSHTSSTSRATNMVLKRMRVLRVLWCVFSEVVRIDSMRLLPITQWAVLGRRFHDRTTTTCFFLMHLLQHLFVA